MYNRTLRYSYYLLFFATPLFWTSVNFELFEFNKMLLVYFLTIIITTTWLLKMLATKTLIFKKTILNIPLLIFLLTNIFSTIFSIDRHTSVWGYYSRANGGLASTVCYLLLFFGLISNLDKKEIIKSIQAALYGGLVVALYAIPEHFGISPSCFILHQQFTAGCWIQDVQARVFATLGQPNWLATYLAMLIFPAVYFFLEAKTTLSRLGYFLMALCYYLAFTFTYSQGATLGLIGGLVVFGLFGWREIGKKSSLAILLGSFLLINLAFGSGLGRFDLSRYLTRQALPAPAQSLPAASESPKTTAGVTQLENGGTDSGKIRLIVWSGAWQIFLHYPIFGSGVETFAYSYYSFRPLAHNLVSEWDFVYNKAHNEFLNYLATTGSIGFLSYLGLIFVFAFWASFKSPHPRLLTVGLVASYFSYLISNFFGFSVVATALFFYLFPALAIASSQTLNNYNIKAFRALGEFFNQSFVNRASRVVIVTVAVFLTVGVVRFWYADTLFAKGQNYSDAGLSTQAYQYLSQATLLRPDEPYYSSEFGFTASTLAVLTSQTDASTSGELQDLAASQTAISLETSPRNVSFLRTAIRTFFQLSTLDPKFEKITFQIIEVATKLAPSDPKVLYNKALILGQLDRYSEAVEALKEAIKLKPNYREAYLTLGEDYAKLKDKDSAREAFEVVLRLVPSDPEALERIKGLDEETQ